MIRARIFRDGPGVWSFRILDNAGDPMVIGHTDTWDLALSGAVGELQLFAGRPKPAPVVCPDIVKRSWLTRLLFGAGR